jgi:preprotein translocase subunit SecG
MTSALIIFYIVIAIALIGLVLLQDPKGGGGAIFGGGGGAGGIFGATGATSFIVKATRVIAILFALCVIGVNYTLMNGNSTSAIDSKTSIVEPVLGGAAATGDPAETNKEENIEEDSAVDSQPKKDDAANGDEQ